MSNNPPDPSTPLTRSFPPPPLPIRIPPPFSRDPLSRVSNPMETIEEEPQDLTISPPASLSNTLCSPNVEIPSESKPEESNPLFRFHPQRCSRPNARDLQYNPHSKQFEIKRGSVIQLSLINQDDIRKYCGGDITMLLWVEHEDPSFAPFPIKNCGSLLHTNHDHPSHVLQLYGENPKTTVSVGSHLAWRLCIPVSSLRHIYLKVCCLGSEVCNRGNFSKARCWVLKGRLLSSPDYDQSFSIPFQSMTLIRAPDRLAKATKGNSLANPAREQLLRKFSLLLRKLPPEVLSYQYEKLSQLCPK